MAFSLEQFVLNLSATRLVSPDEIAAIQRVLQAEKTPHTVDDLGRLLVQSGKLTPYQAAVLCQGQMQGLILGEYVVLDILGRGGMGVVFKARHRRMDRMVALKTLSATMKPETIQRFYREVKAAARLSHPNIVTAYDAGEHDGTHYLVMELVDGNDLSVLVKKHGPMPLRNAIDCMLQAARGLQYAHSQGVVHRDVKPSNLLLDCRGTIKILDMGLARMHETLGHAPPGSLEGSDLTGTGQIMGTIDYMSPEQAEDMRTADHRADVYSLGCTLFYVLTRRPVFGGDTIMKRILAHRHQPVPSILELRPDCPATIDDVLARMLAKRPEDRPQTMDEVIGDLEACLTPMGEAPPVASESGDPGTMSLWLDSLVQPPAVRRTSDVRMLETDDIHSVEPPPLPSPSQRTLGIDSSRVRTDQSSLRMKKRKKAGPLLSRKTRWILGLAALAVFLLVGLVLAVSPAARQSLRTMFDSQPANVADSPAAATARPNPEEKPLTPKPKPAAPDWNAAWSHAEAVANRLIEEHQFGEAIKEYKQLASRFTGGAYRQRCDDAVRQVEAAADDEFGRIEKRARRRLERNEFAEARAMLQPVFKKFGEVRAVQRATALLAEIDAAEKKSPGQAKPAEPVAAKQPEKPPAPLVSPDQLRQQQLDAQFAQAMQAVEGRLRTWDFRGAVDESQKVHFDVPALTARLAERRAQIQRLADFKDRLVTGLNKADPPFQKTELGLRGLNGDLQHADEKGITIVLVNEKRESMAWPEFGFKGAQKVAQKLRQRNEEPENADDWLAVGLLGMAASDLPTAERAFDKAASLGADAASFHGTLAAIELAKARDLLLQQKYPEAESVTTALTQKYGSTPWFAANRSAVEAIGVAAARGRHEGEAETLFAQAAAVLQRDEPFELRPLVRRLQDQFADSLVVADPQRKPSFAEMQRAVADLGPLIRVKKDGSANAKTIQEAVDAAAPRAMILIEDAGPYAEQINVPLGKDGLTIRGKKGVMPVLTTTAAKENYIDHVVVHAPQIRFQSLVILHTGIAAKMGTAILGDDTAVVLRDAIVVGGVHCGRLDAQCGLIVGNLVPSGSVTARNSILFGHLRGGRAPCSLQNVLCWGESFALGRDSEVRHATLAGTLHLMGMANVVENSIFESVRAPKAGNRIEHCNAYGDAPYEGEAAPGDACTKLDPKFVDPKLGHFHLLPASPCRNAASDHTDLGFTFPPDAVELLRQVSELHKSGMIKF